MDLFEAKEFIGSTVALSWLDRHGDVVTEDVHVFEVTFVPFYGPCFVTSQGDIRLDRVESCVASASQTDKAA